MHCNLQILLFLLIVLYSLCSVSAGWYGGEDWYTALRSNINNMDFVYESSVWEDGNPFGNQV